MGDFISIDRYNIEDWKKFTQGAVTLVHIHRQLLDSYVLDFFTQDLWSQLNPKWTSILNQFIPTDLSSFLSCDTALSLNNVLPLSLLSLRAAAFTYSLPRKSVLSLNRLTKYLSTQRPNVSASHVPSQHKSNFHVFDNNPGTKDKLNHESLKYNQSTSEKSVLNTDTERESVNSLNHHQNNSESYPFGSVKNSREASCNNEMVNFVSNEFNDNKKSVNSVKEQCFDHVMQTPHLHVDETNKLSTVISPLQQAEINWGDTASELSAAAGQHKLLQHVFRRHLKPKKQHEVARLALIAGQVCGTAGLSVTVDVGGGQGHLSRLLAYGHSIKVLCLEAEDEFIVGARKFDKQLEAAVEKMKRCQTSLPPLPAAPRHTVCILHPDTSPEIFTQVVCDAWEGEGSFDGCGLVGLHTCGDLGPTMLRLFTQTHTCQALISVGCCYMKLNESVSEQIIQPGCPMSQYLKCLPGHTLSYAAREVACHAIEMYASRLKEGADNLKVHCYRACLEEIIVKFWPHHHHAGLRSVNKAHLMDFPTYAITAVSKLEDIKLPEDDLTSDHTKNNLSRWMQVVVYYSLRLLLAPVVETVILLDRLIFLYENGHDGLLFPAFNPEMSPRNHVLVAVKSNKKE